MKFVRSNNFSLKYKLFTTSGSKDIGITKFEFVEKIQFIFLQIGEVYGVAHAQLSLKNTEQWCNYTITLQSPNYNV